MHPTQILLVGRLGPGVWVSTTFHQLPMIAVALVTDEVVRGCWFVGAFFMITQWQLTASKVGGLL